MKRVFAAFPVTGEIAGDFISLGIRNADVSGVRWTKPANLHITLFFIGEVEEDNLDAIISNLKNGFMEINPFTLIFSAIETKHKKGKPAMIWARFEKTEAFSLLSKQIEESTKEFMTIELQHKDPVPHCTLARMKPTADISHLNLNYDRQFSLEVDHVELWMTVQERDGVVYKKLW